jgi:hypothetical protein
MHKPTHLVAALLLVGGAGAASAAPAPTRGVSNQPAGSSILSHPGLPATPIVHATVIHSPGFYRVLRNFGTGNGAGIVIQADDVTVDLAGHTIFGPGQMHGMGIVVDGASNVKVANGHLRSVGLGVFLNHAENVSVEGLQIDGQDLGGAPPNVEIGVMLIDTRGARIVGNQITRTFLGIFVRGEGSGGNLVADNVVTGGDNGELAICYNPAPDETSGGPDGDLVTGNLISRFRRGLSLSDGSAGNVVRDNTVAYFDIDIQEADPGANLIEDNHLQQIVR